MSESEQCKRCLSRRQFLKLSAASLGAAGLAASQGSSARAVPMVLQDTTVPPVASEEGSRSLPRWE